MAKMANAALQKCPNTKLVLSGYSQGAMVVHHAISKGGISGDKVAAVVVFGDPNAGRSISGVPDNKMLSVCGSSDFLCSRQRGGMTISGGHMSYGSSASKAADFVAGAI